MFLSLLVGLSANAAPVVVEMNHTVSVGIVSPRVIQEGRGERLVVPLEWQVDLWQRLASAGHRVVPSHQAEVLLQPTVQASGCIARRDTMHCSAWVGWRLVTGGNEPLFETESSGVGADLQTASREAWLAAFDVLLSDPAFVQALHYGPMSHYDCAFARKMAAVPTRIAPEPEGTHRSNSAYSPSGSDWSFWLVLDSDVGWTLTGLGLLTGGGLIVGASQAAAAGTDNASVDLVFHGVALFGVAHVVVGASMLGLEVTETTRARVHLTGNGVGVTGRF